MRFFQKRSSAIGMEDWSSAPQVHDINSDKRNQSISELVRKLNCTAAKKGDDEIQQFSVGDCLDSQKSEWGSSYQRTDESSVITRPVLITVKDGDLYQPLQDRRVPVGESNIIVGDVRSYPPSASAVSPFRNPVSARKRHQSTAQCFENPGSKEDNRDLGGWKIENPTRNVGGNRNPVSTQKARALARRERWCRGLEMENRLSRDRPGGYDNQDDHSDADSLTQGSHTTRTTNTGYDTGDFSSIGEWTDATDENGVALRYRKTYAGQCTSSQQVAERLAEDFGILAKLLLSDGYACFRTAAAITRETVADCKGDDW